jgi:hypothetical protein
MDQSHFPRPFTPRNSKSIALLCPFSTVTFPIGHLAYSNGATFASAVSTFSMSISCWFLVFSPEHLQVAPGSHSRRSPSTSPQVIQALPMLLSCRVVVADVEVDLLVAVFLHQWGRNCQNDPQTQPLLCVPQSHQSQHWRNSCSQSRQSQHRLHSVHLLLPESTDQSGRRSRGELNAAGTKKVAPNPDISRLLQFRSR